ncbi:MAG: hypothetical protein PHU45_04075 [Bacilli bacterium]|nr:hypothetical protein [Bacilli bacterium]
MANYVSNKIICTKEILDNYFTDYYPFSPEEKLDKPYITFNKLFGVKSLNEYSEKYGTYIYYGWGFSYKPLNNGLYEIMFATRWYYPICAIIKAIELFKENIEWYAVEENMTYVSRFRYINDKVCEEILSLETKEFEDFDEKYHESRMHENSNLDYGETCAWEYIKRGNMEWKLAQKDDLKEKYFEKYLEKY